MSRDRSSSIDTVKATGITAHSRTHASPRKVVQLWVHDDAFSKEVVLINPTVFEGLHLTSEHLVEIVSLKGTSEVRDFQANAEQTGEGSSDEDGSGLGRETSRESHELLDTDSRTMCLLTLRPLPEEIRVQHPSLQISLNGTIASTLGFRNRSQVVASLVDKCDHTASHVEIGFRDVYLARSDMWKLVESELAGKTVFSGQRIIFLGTVKAVIKNIHVRGRRANAAYFAPTTVPVFRSEAARFVLFVQMSREMWDFDSEGNGEILFNQVINGFLPHLFRRWSSLEVRHLVTIVMFGRLEYGVHDFITPGEPEKVLRNAQPAAATPKTHEDFYRVVVTDMASAKWMTILDELKKDFRVFLRDVSLEHQLNAAKPVSDAQQSDAISQVKIRGRLSTAMKGNILEAINIASSQFANDYIDRDLIRTGISVVVITAGSGVFDVDRDLLNLTSENLTNNGIGIDVVCLSRMPLHSAPLFRYPVPQENRHVKPEHLNSSSHEHARRQPHSDDTERLSNPYSAFSSSVVSSTSPGMSRVASSIFTLDYTKWHYGIPHWIDLSYWSADHTSSASKFDVNHEVQENGIVKRKHTKRFVPRVRMYEPQMMGIMELGLANISIPYLKDISTRARRMRGPLAGMESSAQNQLMQSPKFTQGNTTSGLFTTQVNQHGEKVRNMEAYDATVFNPPRRARSREKSKNLKKISAPSSPNAKRKVKAPSPELTRLKQPQTIRQEITDERKPLKASKGILSLLATPPKPESPRISRSISYALRGLGAPPRATASTEINVENIQAQGLSATRLSAANRPSSSAGSIRSSRNTVDSDERSSKDTESVLQNESEPRQTHEAPSMPISINAAQLKSLREIRRSPMNSETMRLRKSENITSKFQSSNTNTQSEAVQEKDTLEPGDIQKDGISDDSDDGFKPGSVTQDTIPFIRNVNASNPVKYDPNVASWFGRWQHLYPRKPKSATVKWRSLCTPASVPLTTEEFPGLEDLKLDFETATYVTSQKSDGEVRENVKSQRTLFSDMLALRLAHGYQWVMLPQTPEVQGSGRHDSVPIFLHHHLQQSDRNIYMTMGSTLQSLREEGENSVRVTVYRRKPQLYGKETLKTLEYNPNIRTILSQTYKPRTLKLSGFSEEYPWELADSYLADPKKSLKNAVEKLRFWRARFVLLPVDPPPTAWKLAKSSNENEEEIHVLGVQALTQMWHRQRYISAQEKTFSKPAILRTRNPNPLSIMFETLNPSEIVATELDKLVSAEDTGELQPTQLLPESELMERETSTLPQLAEAMQSEKGIEIKNRRWHLRLHHNCFRGEDFTNWLMRIFKEGEFHDRDECVEYGNWLMENGLFAHVNGRHNFKDGNYFYSIAPEYRANRPESRQSWMGFPASRRSEKSVPATPASEKGLKEFKEASPAGRRSRSGSLVEKTETAGDESNNRRSGEKNRVSISLSKMVAIDVDPRKRSSKTEIAHLYYDRLHNPENCYRFALTWPPTTTSALVENALSTWTSQAEKYGLRLVEVPIAEASKVSDNEPFRAPYTISLAVQPPKKPVDGNGIFTPTSFSSITLPTPDPHLYHKAILRKHNFVLDHEAVGEFSSDVDVLLAWGKLNYTMTQYVHRSGVILAQITPDGSFLLLANRLYNARFTSTKDPSSKFAANSATFDRTASRTRAATIGQPTMQASGILGLNAAAPSSPAPSPLVQPRASADVFGNRAALAASGFATYITPEQIKDDLEAFATSVPKLEAFYREVTAVLAGPQSRRSSSAVLSPDRGPDVGIIPEIRLPPSLVTRTLAEGSGGGTGGGRRLPTRDSAQSGSPLAKAQAVDDTSEMVKSPMRGATL